MKNIKIAFLDSGIGGLTVLKDALYAIPNAEYIYFADTANTPYGTKDKRKVLELINEAVIFLDQFNPEALVIACNTATSIAINDIRNKYKFPIIGMEPAIKTAVKNKQDKQILVTATSLTLKEEKMNLLIKTLNVENNIHKLDLDRLVYFAEKFDFGSAEVIEYLENKFKTIDFDNYKSIVLGCTHFIFYKSLIQNIVGSDIEIIDGNSGTVNNLKKILGYQNYPGVLKDNPINIQFYSSGEIDSQERQEILKNILMNGEQNR